MLRHAKMRIITGVIVFLVLMMLSSTAFSDDDICEERMSGEEVVDLALQYDGFPYVFGGSSPSGFDCSGFVYYIYRNAGYEISRVSSSQYYDGELVDRSELDLGDIVLFANTYKRGISHSGIYIGENRFIHAANSRTGVVITDLSDGYYSAKFVTGVRIVDEIRVVHEDAAKYEFIPKGSKNNTNEGVIQYMER